MTNREAKSETEPDVPQVTVHGAGESGMGERRLTNGVMIKVERRTRTKEGEHCVFVALSHEHYERLRESADGRPVNVWLSKLIGRNFDVLLPRNGE